MQTQLKTKICTQHTEQTLREMSTIKVFYTNAYTTKYSMFTLIDFIENKFFCQP